MSVGKGKDIKRFEEILDKELMTLPVLACDGESVIANVLQLTETLYQEGIQRAHALRQGLNVLAPYLIGMKSDTICEPEQLVQDLLFAHHYYHIRELLYYSYNAENSIQWNFKNKTIRIRYQDASIPRQFFITQNNNFLGSLENFSRGENYEKIISLLKGEDEFSNSDNIEQACKLIMTEVQKKFEVYYNFVEDEEDLDLGLFTYQEFKKVYAALLTKALYHRYYVWANQTEGGTIHLPIDDLVNDLSVGTGLPPTVCKKIVETISYSSSAKKRKLDPTYYSLFYLENADIVVMSPNDFAMWPGFSNIYRSVHDNFQEI